MCDAARTKTSAQKEDDDNFCVSLRRFLLLYDDRGNNTPAAHEHDRTVPIFTCGCFYASVKERSERAMAIVSR